MVDTSLIFRAFNLPLDKNFLRANRHCAEKKQLVQYKCLRSQLALKATYFSTRLRR